MIKGSGKLNKETYESLLKQGISAEDIRKGEKKPAACGAPNAGSQRVRFVLGYATPL